MTRRFPAPAHVATPALAHVATLALAHVATLALALTTACSPARPPGATSAAQPPAATSAAGPGPRIHAFKIGALDAVALSDGNLGVPNDGKTFGLGHSPAEVGDLLAAAGLARDPIELDMQPLLVHDGARTLLFDTGAAGATWARGGLLPRSLALAHVAPADITDIFISHAHEDHVGGLATPGASLAFPNATVHISAPEWAALQDEAKTDATAKRIADAIAPKVAAFAPGAQLLPEVTAVATPGHTVGHSSYEIASNGDKLFYLGDVAHHVILSVQRPDWSIEFESAHAEAAAMRAQVLARLATGGERVYAFHFPFPGLGHIREGAGAFAFEPSDGE